MATDTSKITTAANDLGDGLTKGGGAAKTLGSEIANAIKSLDSRVAALEAGGGSNPNPPDPGPGPSTDGKIEGFKPASSANYTVGGVSVSNQNANKSWSVTKPDDYTLRFEQRAGDLWTEGDSTNRSEISWGPHWNAGETYKAKFKITLHAGQFTTDWMTLDQVHDTLGIAAPYVIELQNEKFTILARYIKSGQSSHTTETVWQGSTVQREKEYAFEVQFKFNPGGGGFLKAWMDGQQIVNYSGQFGFNCSQYYYKNGIYRSKNNFTGTVAVSYRNMTLERM